MVPNMTEEERTALIIERAELQRKYTKRLNVAGYAANAASLLARIEVIDAALDAPASEAGPSEPTATESLAGRTLGDPDASPTEKSLAASVLAKSGD